MPRSKRNCCHVTKKYTVRVNIFDPCVDVDYRLSGRMDVFQPTDSSPVYSPKLVEDEPCV